MVPFSSRSPVAGAIVQQLRYDSWMGLLFQKRFHAGILDAGSSVRR
jgi:hypothetical protein